MKQLSSLLLSLFILLLLCPAAPSAATAEAFGSSALFLQESITSPGPADLTVTLVCGAEPVDSISLRDSEENVIAELGALESGQTVTTQVTVTLTQPQLDAARLDLLLSWHTTDDFHTQGLTVPIPVGVPTPDVCFSRKVSDRFADSEGHASLIYRVENTGDLTLTDISVTDPAGAYTGTAASLEPGEMLAFSQTVDVDGAVTSAPMLTCTAGETRLERTLAEYTIQTAEPELSAALSAEPTDTGAVKLTLYIINTGAVSYTSLAVYDDINGGLIADALSLPAGSAPITLEHVCADNGGSDYRLRVTGITEAGDTVSTTAAVTDYTSIHGNGEYWLSMSVSPEKTRIRRAGYVAVDITITNAGPGIAHAVKLSEETLGTVYTFAAVPAGVPTDYTYNVEIRQDTTLNIRMEWTDTEGHLHVVYADPITVEIAKDGVDPDPAPDPLSPLADMTAASSSNPNLYSLLLAGGLALVLALTLVLVIPARRRRQRRADTEEPTH